MPKLNNIRDIIDCKLEMNNELLIIYGTYIPNTTWHQMAYQVLTLLDVYFCTTWGNGNKPNMRCNEQ